MISGTGGAAIAFDTSAIAALSGSARYTELGTTVLTYGAMRLCPSTDALMSIITACSGTTCIFGVWRTSSIDSVSGRGSGEADAEGEGESACTPCHF